MTKIHLHTFRPNDAHNKFMDPYEKCLTEGCTFMIKDIAALFGKDNTRLEHILRTRSAHNPYIYESY